MNTTEHAALSFDGFGINGTDQYRTRVATFQSNGDANRYGKMFAAAPELLEACELVNEWYDLVKQSYPEMIRPFIAVRAAIAKATT